MAEHPRVNFRYVQPEYHDLPVRLQGMYHRCGNYLPKPNSITKYGPPSCGNCNKIVPWFFNKCVVCDKFFIQDFRHPKFCSFYPTCWEHTLELEWDNCQTHKPNALTIPFFSRIVEPIGLNPREFSTEELSGVFDF